VPTTQVSLIREHTETMRPPRALWVPFELGRPLGAPDAPEFQHRVLGAALALLEAESGPVLVDFPDEAPDAGIIEGWACPVSFPAPATDDDDLVSLLLREVEQLGPWHDLWLEARGRTTVGASRVDIDAGARFMAGFLDQTSPSRPREDVSSAELMKLVLEDIKAFYLEAALAQPGDATAVAAADWFWGETTAGRIMLTLNPILEDHPDEAMRFLAKFLLVPRAQQYRLEALAGDLAGTEGSV
jgi:hypothetical protein